MLRPVHGELAFLAVLKPHSARFTLPFTHLQTAIYQCECEYLPDPTNLAKSTAYC